MGIKQVIDVKSSGSAVSDFSTGDYMQSARSSKDGWLLCDGAIISRTTYAALFSIISTAFGVGDGSTTFTLPDFRGRVFGAIGLGATLTNRILGEYIGEEEHLLTGNESGIKKHTHGYVNNKPALQNNNTTAPNNGSAGALPYVRDSNGSTYNDGNFDGGRFYNDGGTFHSAADMDWVQKQSAIIKDIENENAIEKHNTMQPTLFGGNIFIKY